jgi:hypothetical protein
MITTKKVTIHYGWDEYNRKYRWWQDNHPGDAFDLVTENDLQARIDAANEAGMTAVPDLFDLWDQDDAGL